MKAAQIERYNKELRVRINDIPVPGIGDQDILLRVKAASVNPVDILNLTGAVRLIQDYKMPLTFLQRLPLIGRFFIKEHDDNFMNLMNGLNEEYGLDITVRMKQMRKDFIR